MNNFPKIFDYNDNDVRIILINNEPWWIVKDVCKILKMDHTSNSKIIKFLEGREKDKIIIHTPGGPQKLNIINESGLYNLIIRSRKPEAKKFRIWITATVLPTIRKTGTYSLKSKDSYQIEDPIKRALTWVEEEKQRQKLLLDNTHKQQIIVDQNDIIQDQEEDIIIKDEIIEDQKEDVNTLGKICKQDQLLMDAQQASKLANFNPPIGRNKLMRLMREAHILMETQYYTYKEGNINYRVTANIPYQSFIDRKYFKIKMNFHRIHSTKINCYKQFFFTPKGLAFIIKRFSHLNTNTD